VSDLQDRIQKELDDLVASGRETAAQFAAYLHGEPIVDACAGPVTRGTPFFSFSTGKGLTSTAVHVLAEQGALSYDLRLAEVWPEFARHGKDGITLRHVLTHSAGLPALPPELTRAELCDPGRMAGILADSAPVWEPGTRHGYHVWTYGWLVGETVRRVTGRTLSQVLADEVAGPLGVPGELLLAVPEDALGGLAPVRDGNWSAALDGLAAMLPNFARAVPAGARPDADLAGDPAFLRAEVPATGTVSARAAARMYAALLGEVDGVRLISPERLAEVSAVASTGPDWTFLMDVTRTLGYGVEADGRMFGASGIGGSLAGAAPALGLALAATKSTLAVDDGDPMERLRTLVLDDLTR
jgi:CubicO group peptidase (beta-lactamase class C family)